MQFWVRHMVGKLWHNLPRLHKSCFDQGMNIVTHQWYKGGDKVTIKPDICVCAVRTHWCMLFTNWNDNILVWKKHVEHFRTGYKNLKSEDLLPLRFHWYFAIFPSIHAIEYFLQNLFFTVSLPLQFSCGLLSIPLLLTKGLSGLSTLTFFPPIFQLQNSFQNSPVQSWKKWKQQKRILHVILAHQEIAV